MVFRPIGHIRSTPAFAEYANISTTYIIQVEPDQFRDSQAAGIKGLRGLLGLAFDST